MSNRISRSLTLLRVFVGLSAGVLLAGGFVLGWLVTAAIRNQAVHDAKASLTQYVDGVLAAELLEGGRLLVRKSLPASTRRELSNRSDILSVKVWRRDGTLAWTNREEERIGHRFPVEGHLAEAIEGKTEAEFEELERSEHEGEQLAGIERALEVYTPLRAAGGGVVGAYEVYADPAKLETAISERRRQIWLVIAAVFLALWIALALLVRRASRLLQRQTRELRMRSAALAESYSALTQSSLEAIETLNATVEAKDPYTAGHSRRVQQVALAIGRQLGLREVETKALRWGGLFHDVGKIAVPDAILTKPGRLTDEEFELIKTHSAEGARIVAKLSGLRHAVPTIRHHHERWDGRGYPDGLAGDEIPLTAAIVGLADAWDAMTTDRPYKTALTVDRALGEISGGRGSQFAPKVVDAFLRAFERDPDTFGADRHYAVLAESLV